MLMCLIKLSKRWRPVMLVSSLERPQWSIQLRCLHLELLNEEFQLLNSTSKKQTPRENFSNFKIIIHCLRQLGEQLFFKNFASSEGNIQNPFLGNCSAYIAIIITI
uniref:MatK_2 protein n=1 Tax=Fopius arisanus TaxID=64838 RepID=A0A0C9RB04_9HYME